MADLLSLAAGRRCRRSASPSCCTALAEAHPGHRVAGIAATYWHFVEITRPLDAGERATLERLLTYGPEATTRRTAARRTCSSCRVRARSRRGRRRRPTSRATAGSTPSRASSAASCIAIATRDGGRLRASDRAALLPLIHDRMTEAVFDDVATPRALFAHVAPRPLTTIPLLADGRARARARQRRARARAGARRDRLPRRELPRARPRSRPTSSS